MPMMTLAASFLLLAGQEPPQRDPALEGLTYLIGHQGVDGSWGGRPGSCRCKRDPEGVGEGDLETTAWALLAFAGAGFTELSKDEFGGRAIGPAMGSAMEWLLSKEDQDGAFDRTNIPVNALASLALFEIYGMTLRHQPAAGRAFSWLRKATPDTSLARIRSGMAWESAMLGELTKDSREPLRELAGALERGTSASDKAGGLLLRTFAEWPRGSPRGKVDYPSVDPLKLSAEECNLLTVAWCQKDGGTEWHAWYDLLRKNLRALQCREETACERGSWGERTTRERLRTSAIRTLTMEHYRCFFCRNPFRK